MKKKILPTLLCILSLLFLAACNKEEGTSSNMEGNSDGKLKTIPPSIRFNTLLNGLAGNSLQ